MDAVTSGRVQIHPERYAKTYLDWLGEKRDWCISRNLWWGKVAETENVEIYRVPGTHETCRTEYLHDLAQQLSICLRKVQVL